MLIVKFDKLLWDVLGVWERGGNDCVFISKYIFQFIVKSRLNNFPRCYSITNLFSRIASEFQNILLYFLSNQYSF